VSILRTGKNDGTEETRSVIIYYHSNFVKNNIRGQLTFDAQETAPAAFLLRRETQTLRFQAGQQRSEDGGGKHRALTYSVSCGQCLLLQMRAELPSPTPQRILLLPSVVDIVPGMGRSVRECCGGDRGFNPDRLGGGVFISRLALGRAAADGSSADLDSLPICCCPCRSEFELQRQ
jgi:hypothetical protein